MRLLGSLARARGNLLALPRGAVVRQTEGPGPCIALGSDDREFKWRWRRAPSRLERIVDVLARLIARARDNTCALPRTTTAKEKRLRALILFGFRVDRPRISTARRGRPAALVLDLLARLVLVAKHLGRSWMLVGSSFGICL